MLRTKTHFTADHKPSWESFNLSRRLLVSRFHCRRGEEFLTEVLSYAYFCYLYMIINGDMNRNNSPHYFHFCAWRLHAMGRFTHFIGLRLPQLVRWFLSPSRQFRWTIIWPLDGCLLHIRSFSVSLFLIPHVPSCLLPLPDKHESQRCSHVLGRSLIASAWWS